MRKIFLPYCICIFLTGMSVVAHAAAVTPAYKLGQSYSSETSTSSNCLEGYAGANLNDSKCKDISSECKSNADCTNRFGKNWVCAKGKYTYAKSGVCRYQECSGTGDTSCSTKYSHLRSCVLNEVGVYECRITCNWQKIKESDKALLGSANIADRMKIERQMYQSPTNAMTYLNGKVGSGKMFEGSARSMLVAENWKTCINGKIASCDATNIFKQLTGAQWTTVSQRPCIPCVLMDGGTYGTGSDENINHAGNYPYAVTAMTWTDSEKITLGREYQYVVAGNFWAHTFSSGCGSASSLMLNGLAERMNQIIPFNTLLNSGLRPTLSQFNLTGGIHLGESNICAFYGLSPKYQISSSSDCDGSRNCVKSTVMTELIWIPQQSKSVRMYDRGTTKTSGCGTGRTKCPVETSINFNVSGGSLLCCRIEMGEDTSKPAGCIRISP